MFDFFAMRVKRHFYARNKTDVFKLNGSNYLTTENFIKKSFKGLLHSIGKNRVRFIKF